MVAKRDIIYRGGEGERSGKRGRKEGERTPPAFPRLEGLGHGDYYRRGRGYAVERTEEEAAGGNRS